MPLGKTLILLGLALIAVGVFLTFGARIPFLGKLPGDIRIERENFSFYFPLTTSLIVSLLVSFIFWLLRR